MKRYTFLSAVALLTAAVLMSAIFPVYGAEETDAAAEPLIEKTAAAVVAGTLIKGNGMSLKYEESGETEEPCEAEESGKTKESVEIKGAQKTEKARDGMISLAQTYDSSTKWLIMTNVTTHMVGVFYRNGSYWDLRREFRSSTGAPESPTVEGEFSVQSKMQYFGTSSYRCWYATQFYGNYLFHSVLYNVESEPRTVQDGRLGMAISHGCVRMRLEDAKWIYDNIPSKTKVVVYH